ncbi:MAG: MFS transporter [Rickettsiales bacterium]
MHAMARHQTSLRKAVIAGMIGNGLEWYDYALYGQLATILSLHFFPKENPTLALLATFGVFAVGFVFRPLGAVIFGYIGDTYGRQKSLVIAIMMMAIPTGCIGLLPTYEQIGILAPILLTLIRILQGMSLGGEFSGSITYIVEHAPPHRRGIAGSASMISLVIGFLTGSLVAMLFSYAMPKELFENWGWRIPFVLGIVIGFVGFYIRSKCGESPAYEEAKQSGALSKTPLRDTLLHYPFPIFQGFAIYLTVTLPFYLVAIYFISFMEKELGLSHSQALLINTLAMFSMLIAQPASALLSDRIGRRKVLLWAGTAMAIIVFPVFDAMAKGDFMTILLAQVVFAFINGLFLAPVPAVLVELFPTSVRYTGMAISYNAAAALVGGTAPMMAVWLIDATGTRMSVAGYVFAVALVSLVVLYFYKDRFREPLR